MLTKVGRLFLFLSVLCVVQASAQESSGIGVMSIGPAFAVGDAAYIGEKAFNISLWAATDTDPWGYGLECHYMFADSDIDILFNEDVNQLGTAWSFGFLGARFSETSPSISTSITLGAGMYRSGTDVEAARAGYEIVGQEDYEFRDWGVYVSHRYGILRHFERWKDAKLSLNVQVRHAFISDEVQTWIVPNIGIAF